MQAPAISQQPSGQEDGLQTHLPLASHVCPTAHAMQAVPGAPHASRVGVTQAPVFVQQPVVHVGPHWQAPWLHACPGAHATQRDPAAPQAPVVGVVTHMSFASQQPLGQVVALHRAVTSGGGVSTRTSGSTPGPS
jgi:hypothetical protein